MKNKIYNNGTISAAVHETSTSLEILKNGTLVFAGGVDYHLLSTLSRALNLEFKVVTAIDGEYGLCKDNGYCSGIVGMVQRNEADIALTLSMTPSRSRYVNFSQPYYFDVSTFVTRAAGSGNSIKMFFFAPFRAELWIFLASMFLIFCIILNFTQKCVCNWKSSSRSYQKRIPFGVWGLITITLTQGLPKFSLLCPVQAISIWFILAFETILAKIYGSHITSSTTIQSKNDSIDSIEELLFAIKSNGYSVQTLRGSYYLGYIEESTNEVLLQLASSVRKSESNRVYNYAEGLRNVLNGKVALIGGEAFIKGNIDEGHFDQNLFHIAQVPFASDDASLCFRKEYRYKAQISSKLLWMIATGLFNKWQMQEKFVSEFKRLSSRPTTEYINYINIGDITPVIVLGAVLLIGSGVVVLIELNP